MDKFIKKSKKRKYIITVAILIISVIAVKILTSKYEPEYNIKKSELITCFITEKEISKNISTTGTVVSQNREILESVEGGVIRSIPAVSGSYIEQGQVLMTLSSEDIELEHYNLLEQLTKLKQQLQISINEFSITDIDHSELLLEIDYKISQLKISIEKNTLLNKQGSVSEKTLTDIKNEYNFWIEKKLLTVEKWKRTTTLHQSNKELINLEIDSLNKNIKNISIRESRLIIEAPCSGILALESFDIGQNIRSRQKLGIIDKQTGFKLIANINEFYISELNIGDTAQFNNTDLRLSFISPEVVDKTVRIEFLFTSEPPNNIKSGQSFTVKILQNSAEPKKVIESGAFIKDSGGSWIYKVENRKGIKTPVEFGIKNSTYYEVVEGLELGDEVIISSYKKYKEYKVINLEE